MWHKITKPIPNSGPGFFIFEVKVNQPFKLFPSCLGAFGKRETTKLWTFGFGLVELLGNQKIGSFKPLFLNSGKPEITAFRMFCIWVPGFVKAGKCGVFDHSLAGCLRSCETEKYESADLLLLGSWNPENSYKGGHWTFVQQEGWRTRVFNNLIFSKSGLFGELTAVQENKLRVLALEHAGTMADRAHRGASLTRKCTPREPYRRPMPRVPGES